MNLILYLEVNMSKKCPKCKRIYDDTQKMCTACYIALPKNDVPNIPRCPTCSSTKVKKISTASKAIGFAMVGIFSSNLGKQMQCENCGYKW